MLQPTYRPHGRPQASTGCRTCAHQTHRADDCLFEELPLAETRPILVEAFHSVEQLLIGGTRDLGAA